MRINFNYVFLILGTNILVTTSKEETSFKIIGDSAELEDSLGSGIYWNGTVKLISK